MFGVTDLWRRRSVDVNVGLGFRFCRRRWIHNGGVALLFLSRRIRYGRLFLLTRREERGANQEADVFVHKYWTCWVVDYLRSWRWARRGGCAGGCFRRSGRAGGRRYRFSLLFASREQHGAGQNADVFLHKRKVR
jgi:hypothetical protein